MRRPAGERWLFRIDFKQYGPVEASYLVELLQPPRLVRRIEVRPASREGDDWFVIGPEDDFASAARYFGVEVRAAGSGAVGGGGGRRASAGSARLGQAVEAVVSPVREFLADYWWAVLAIVTWVVVNAAVYQFTINADAQERQYLETYSQVWHDIEQMRTQEVSGEEWEQFAGQAKTRVEPIVAELSGSADVDHPARRYLLWAGRDCLLPLLSAKEPPEENDRLERAFQQHLEAATDVLGGPQ